MIDVNDMILEMIKQNKSMKEICSFFNISQKQFYIKLKSIIKQNPLLTPEYFYNSDIYYRFDSEIKDNEIKINVPDKINEIRVIVISDTHIGNIDFDFDLLKRVYDYAAKNNINIIFNCGDLIEGVYSGDKKKLKDLDSQINALIKKHPYDKNINNYVILGNHDLHSFCFDKIDILPIIKNARYDIVPIGYGKGIVNLKEDKLLLQHELSVMDNPIIDCDSKLIIVGHGHMMKTKIYSDGLFMCAPTLSHVSPDKTKVAIPGFIDMSIQFKDNKFDYIKAHHYIINPDICEISQSRCKIRNLFNEEPLRFEEKNKGLILK